MIKIYINYFNAAHIMTNSVLTPIQGGRAQSDNKLAMIGDDTGDNISEKNPSYCELTGQYWAWKNDKSADYIGFFHYRRLLDFRPERKRDVTEHGIIVKSFSEDFIDEFGLTPQQIAKTIDNYDVILPEAFNVKHVGAHSLRNQYATSPYHHLKDLEQAGKAIRDLYPKDFRYYEKALQGSEIYAGNIFIFKRQLFDAYCQWLFPILERLEKTIDTTHYNTQERRVTGYIAERLLTIYVLKLRSEQPQLRFRFLRRVFVENTSPKPLSPELPHTDLPVVSVVAASDQNYLPHLAALIRSVFHHADKQRFIDFLVLDGGLRPADRAQLQSLCSYHPHCRLHFIHMSGLFLDLPVHAHFTRSTYYRLMIPELFINHKKILYLDSDMVTRRDVSALYDTDLGGAHIAAAKDLIMASFTAMRVPSLLEAGGQEAGIYLQKHLKLGIHAADYFQAGVIVFDLEKFRHSNITAAMLRDLTEHRFWFLDQDVLNKHLVGKVKFVDAYWNTVTMDEQHLSYLNPALKKAYASSHKDPGIIHFAGAFKPWEGYVSQFSPDYWTNLRDTPWYEGVLINAASKRLHDVLHPPVALGGSRLRRFLSRVWRHMPRFCKSALRPIAIKLSASVR